MTRKSSDATVTDTDVDDCATYLRRRTSKSQVPVGTNYIQPAPMADSSRSVVTFTGRRVNDPREVFFTSYGRFRQAYKMEPNIRNLECRKIFRFTPVI
jgi:hypothetical protein